MAYLRCGEKVAQRNRTNPQSCCGKKMYSYKTQVCCYGKAKATRRIYCCGKKTYDFFTQLCCMYKVVARNIYMKLLSLVVFPNLIITKPNSAAVDKYTQEHLATTKSTTTIHIIAVIEISPRKYHLTQGAVMVQLTTILNSSAVTER